ncbi:IS66 family insertion sequence element accessory protein TnpB [Paraburkholderia terrae]|uniref:IS66 family insertion sequence element accessory protein TnpB n=1 Tax=Paraburkholderia terrae TaxID=311230 RepID=UPI001EE26882|nr:IS66 family insertion sequence element accessory protein TnpB [Paraburkholderia terrae]
MICIGKVWLAVDLWDMRAGFETALVHVIKLFDVARPRHAHLFINRGANRVKVLVHGDIGIWLAARRLRQRRFAWTSSDESKQYALTHEQLASLDIGLLAHRRSYARDGSPSDDPVA